MSHDTREYGIAPPGHRLPDATRPGPVRLQVADAARSEEFYGRLLGLERRGRDGARTSLGAAGGREPLIDLVERPGVAPVPPRGRLGLYHFALRVPDRAALGGLAAHLADLDARVGMADHLVSEALYLTDPDGLGVEVYADRPRDRWEVSGRQLVMTTEPLDVEGLVAEAGGRPFEGLPPATVVGHVHLHVGSLEDAAGFYHEALGLDKVVWDYPGALFMSAGGYHHHLGTNTWAGGAAPAGDNDARLLSWTLVLPDAEHVDRTAESVEAAGYPVVRRDGRLLAEDPWGTNVELVSAGGDG